MSPTRIDASVGIHGKAWARSRVDPPMEEEEMVVDEVAGVLQTSSSHRGCGVAA